MSGIEIYTDRGNATKLEYVRVENVEVSDFGFAGILLVANPKDGTKSGFRDVRITNVSAHDNAEAGIQSYGYYPRSANGWAHEDVFIGSSYAYANRGIPDKGANAGSGIVLGDVNGATIERCVAYDNGENNDHQHGGPFGIWTWDSNAVTIQHNESYPCLPWQTEHCQLEQREGRSRACEHQRGWAWRWLVDPIWRLARFTAPYVKIVQSSLLAR